MSDIQSSEVTAPLEAVTPSGLNHLVLNVRNIEESHRFWTEILGFKQVAELHPSPARPNPPKMRFYSGDHGGRSAITTWRLWKTQTCRRRPRTGQCGTCQWLLTISL